MEDKIEKVEGEIHHSKLNMVSYGFGRAFRQLLLMAFSAFTFYYYESEIGLNLWLTSLGYIIYAIWNAVNDPIVGFITNRRFKFTQKWGRFFPWTIIGGIPWVLSYLLVFLPPNVNPVSGEWIIFLWLVFSTCLFDTFASIYEINFWGMFPMKFTSLKERRIANGYGVLVGVIGTTLGGLLPPLLVIYGNKQSYIIQGGVVILGCLILLSLAIPGVKDDPEMIKRFLHRNEENTEHTKFINSLKKALTQRSFTSYIILYLFFTATYTVVQANLPFMVRFVFGQQALGQSLLQVGFLIGAVGSIPFWVILAQRLNNEKKSMIIACLMLSFISLLLTFINTSLIMFFILILWGFGLGGIWAYSSPVMSTTVDDYTATYEKHEEGILFGIQQFFGRFAIIIQALSFATVHSITGFVEGASTQPASAIWGIQLLFGFFPMIFMLIGTLFFWKFYDLTPEKMEFTKERLRKLKI